MLWNKQQSTNYMGKFWRGTYVAQLCISGQKQLNTDWRLCQVSQISKKQHFTRFTTQPWPFQALERGDLLIIVNPNHHCHHKYHHRCHHDTHISDPFPLLVDTPHLTNAVPIAGRVLKKESQFEFFLFLWCACWKQRKSIWFFWDCLSGRAEKKRK